MAAGSIIIDLLMKTGAFETDTKKAQKRIKELRKEADEAGRAIGLAFAAVGTATVLLVKSQIDAADAAGKAAAAAGLTVESYSALAYAAELAGVDAASFGTALNNLNKNISENDKALKELGISTKTASGDLKSSETVLSEIADRFATFPDGARKSELAIQLFGRAGTQLIPLLNAGSKGISDLTAEAKRLGIVIDSETAQAAEEFNDNLTRLAAQSKAFGLQIAKEVLPFLDELSKNLVRNAKDFGTLRGAFVSFYETVLGGTEPADILEEQSKLTTDAIKGLREEIARASAPGARQTGLEEMRAKLVELEAQSRKTSQAIADALNDAAGRTRFGRGVGFVDPRVPKPQAPGKEEKPKADKQSEAERYLETLQKQAETTLELTSLEQALLDIQAGRLKGLTPELQKAILAQAEFNDLNKQAIEKRDAEVSTTTRAARAQLDSLEALQKSNEALRQEIDLIGLDEIGQTAVERARVSSLRAQKEETRAKQEALGVSDQQLQALDAEIEALRTREELLGRKIDRSIEERSKENAKKTGEDVSDALARSIEDGILEGFRKGNSLADVFLNELKAQFARTVLRPIIQPVADAGNSLLKDIIGTIAGAIGSGPGYNPAGDSNSQTGEQIRNRRAGGGRIYPGGDVLVGEKGPELIRPVTSGNVLPQHMLAAAGGGAPQVIVNTPPGVTVERQQTSNDGRRIELWLASRISSGESPINTALRTRGVNTSGNLPRRK